MPTQEHDPRPEAELARGLDALRPAARPEFRATLREGFRAGAQGVQGAQGADGTEVADPEPALARALDRLEPRPRPEFRAALRALFVGAAARGTRPRLRLVVGGSALLLAAAAALVLWVLGPSPGSRPGWTVDPRVYVADALTIDGRLVPADAQPERVRELLVGAQEVGALGSGVRLVLGDLFVVELEPDSTLDLSRMPPDPREGRLVLAAQSGVFRFATGPGFPGRELRFEAPDVHVEVVGTVFGIDCFEAMTCVCVQEGTVRTTPRVDAPGYAAGEVGARETNLFHRDGTPLFEARDYEPHQEPLRRLATFWDR